jgi:TolA-binding protein
MRIRTFILAAFTLTAITLTCAHANEAPPASPPPAPAPAAPPADAPPPAVKPDEPPAAPAPPPPTSAAPPPGPKPGSLSSRISAAAAAMRGQGAVAAQIAERDSTIATLRAENTRLTGQVTQLTGQVAQQRTELDAVEATVRTLEGQRSTVTDTLATLGFPQDKLPAASDGDTAAENSPEGLQAKLKSETDPLARAEIAQRIITLRDKKK